MKCKSIKLMSGTAADMKTEIMYEVVSARVAGSEMLKISIIDSDATVREKRFGTAQRILRGMKSGGAIQFLATSQSFEMSSTEAQFLLNKYPDVFEESPKNVANEDFIYVKI